MQFLRTKNFLENSCLDLTMRINIIEFLNSSFISFLNHLSYLELILISIIFLSSKAQKVLDTASKVVTITTGGTVLYNNWIKGESSGSDKDDDENKKDDNKKEENKEEKPTDSTNEK
nr:hypothetical protein [Russula sp.]